MTECSWLLILTSSDWSLHPGGPDSWWSTKSFNMKIWLFEVEEGHNITENLITWSSLCVICFLKIFSLFSRIVEVCLAVSLDYCGLWNLVCYLKLVIIVIEHISPCWQSWWMTDCPGYSCSCRGWVGGDILLSCVHRAWYFVCGLDRVVTCCWDTEWTRSSVHFQNRPWNLYLLVISHYMLNHVFVPLELYQHIIHREVDTNNKFLIVWLFVCNKCPLMGLE